jgi:uncharacterized protein
MDILIAIAIFLTGIAASFIGGVTSGGGGLISLPILIFLGLPPEVAVATNRFGVLGSVVGNLARFLRSDKIIYRYMIPLVVVSTIGGILGANLLIDIDKTILSKIIGLVILILLPIILWKKDLGVLEKSRVRSKMLYFGFIVYFVLSVYDGFLGIGGGILVAYLFVFIFGFTYVQANATEKVAVFLNVLFSVAIFAFHNLINYYYGVIYIAGSLIGGYLGAHTAIKKGDKWVRAVFVIIAIIFGIKLVFFG